MKKLIKKLREGFTLVELMLSVFIILISVAALSSAIFWVAYTTGDTNTSVTGIQIAQAKFEELLSSDFSDIADGSEAIDPYTIDWTVVDNDNEKEIEVIVRWTDSKNRARELILQTIATENEFDLAGLNFSDIFVTSGS